MTYHAGLFEGQGTVWNLSLTGWRFSGNLPSRVVQSFPMTVTLPNQQSISSPLDCSMERGNEYGVETLVADAAALGQVKDYVTQQSVR